MPYSIQLVPEFENPFRDLQAWTVAYRVDGPEASGTVWVTPHVAEHDTYRKPTGITICYGPGEPVWSSAEVGIVVKGLPLVGTVLVESPASGESVASCIAKATSYGAPTTPEGRRIVNEILQLVVETYLADPDAVQAKRNDFLKDWVPRRLSRVEKDIKACEDQIAHATQRRDELLAEAERLREPVG